MEPETQGHIVSGMKFHEHFFSLSDGKKGTVTTTMANVTVRTCADMGIVAYNRMTQRGEAVNVALETRVWERRDGKWLHTHFHKSLP